VVRYADDLLQRRWHDGTPHTLADFLLHVITMFERPSKDSTLFDAAEVPLFQTFVQYFRGVKIVQDDPLAVEFYSDQPSPDAEWLAYLAARIRVQHGQHGPREARLHGTRWLSVCWRTATGGWRFSADKAEKLKIERMSYNRGSQPANLGGISAQSGGRGLYPLREDAGRLRDQGAGQAALRGSAAVVRQEKTFLGWGRPIRHRVGTPVGKDGGRAALSTNSAN